MLAHLLHTHGSTNSLHHNAPDVHTCTCRAAEDSRIIVEGLTSDRVPREGGPDTGSHLSSNGR